MAVTKTLRQAVFAMLKPNIFLKQAVKATIVMIGDIIEPNWSDRSLSMT